ncbi:ribonuclease P protein component [Mycoplasma mycoides subsp. mycoides]|uniref:Ribonuclease P protein component n=2 Tax=Mycoplasma mycoides subsp. mycoides TaxID=2103 RepID=RNPA_MYCMS|nr:ribonuclease P protein component [Mycoplasma mycoides]Q6MRS3.1 RecName: Full=Ribonuclease P protein component; Short=RNase P protein; Short=RNaseP protein; AltName: Full=Protein C5 [Mycoplasma mycoides subsp. mycoides SC str. PG1]ADK69891.1 ribonuclease P protein component [Mycoplasma mycoides subsp. mycoides SC str. Gladysdale]AIZ55910.1 ribonuclease P protein component [Mycoplasma mycoides subsp. mycoides]AME11218.1 ribonuclease P (protein C5) [Mycoplasma mycoides subsp. mycoides]AME12231
MKNKRVIKKNFEFQEIINYKKTIKNFCFIIYYKDNDQSYLKYGISVGKKIGNAVVRNKVKRQIRMILRQNINEIGTISKDVIILVRKSVLKLKYATLSKSLIKLIKEIK